MIGYLRGTLQDKQPPHLLLDVNGVGYEIESPMTTFYDLPAVGEEISLYTHLAVRDDAHVLYGFSRLAERSLFRNLIKVNGVGAKLALTLLSGMDAASLALCVQQGDTAALIRLPGVGKKTAERLVMEMRDRLDETPPPVVTGQSGVASAPVDPVEEALSALIGLGYKPQEASRMVRMVETVELSSEDIIRSALQAAIQ